jgi:hypothetical protein
MQIEKIENEEQFIRQIEAKRSEFIIHLQVCFTRWTIQVYKGKKVEHYGKYKVYSHFADTTEFATIEELFDTNLYNFRKAIENKALSLVIKN